MTKYRLVTAADETLLLELVQLALNNGWECQGGVAILVRQDWRRLYQAMVKHYD